MGIFSNWGKESRNIVPIESTKSTESEKATTYTIDSAEQLGEQSIAPDPKYRHIDIPDWIEMEGYKAVDANMKAFYGNMTYTLGVTYKITKPLIPCEHGFHFCRTLEDTLKLFPPILGRRYFKVRALVPASGYIDNNGKTHISAKSCQRLVYEQEMAKYYVEAKATSRGSFYCPIKPCFDDFDSLKTKYAAKELTLIEEVSFEVYADKALSHNIFVTSKEDYQSLTTEGKIKLKALTAWTKEAKEIFSEGFSSYLFEERFKKEEDIKGNPFRRSEATYQTLCNTLEAIKNENISQDMKTLYMLKLSKIF